MASKNSLEQLEARIRDVSLDFEPEWMRRAGYRVVDWIVARLGNLADPQAGLGEELTRDETERLLREPLPEQPSPFEYVFDQYARSVAPNAVCLDHPRFFAFIPSAPSFVSILADALAAGTNVFAGTWLESSGPSQVELVVLDWFKQMLGLPSEAAGLLVSGGSVANLTALAVARKAQLNDQVSDAVVYLSDQTHASIDRGLRVLAFSRNQLRRIPTDSAYRLDTLALAEQIRHDRAAGLRALAVVASAGTTNTGAIDPLEEIARIARENSIWFHVDAAYGGFAALTSRGREALRGIELADSVVLDPHKWFYCPFEAGCVLVRQGRLMRETFRILPEYMRDVAREEREVNFCDYGLQLTRSFRALKVWMSVKTYGAARLREVIDQCLDLTEYAAQLFAQSPRLAIVTPPSLGVFTFQYIPRKLPLNEARCQAALNRVNENLMKMIISSRKLMLSSTQLGTRHVLRFCVLNHRSRKEDVRMALQIILDLGREAERRLRQEAGN
jgi:glutamate/tyrosine decarboxylase-like PLP-dependent enzyme